MLDVPFCYEGQKPEDRTTSWPSSRPHRHHRRAERPEVRPGQGAGGGELSQHAPRSGSASSAWRPTGRRASPPSIPSCRWRPSSPRAAPGTRGHFRLLADETEEQMRKGIFPVPGERYRLLWDNIAPWHQLRKMSTRLAGLDANITARATPTAWAPWRANTICRVRRGTTPSLAGPAAELLGVPLRHGPPGQGHDRGHRRLRHRRRGLRQQPELQGLLAHADGPDADVSATSWASRAS